MTQFHYLQYTCAYCVFSTDFREGGRGRSHMKLIRDHEGGIDKRRVQPHLQKVLVNWDANWCKTVPLGDDFLLSICNGRTFCHIVNFHKEGCDSSEGHGLSIMCTAMYMLMSSGLVKAKFSLRLICRRKNPPPKGPLRTKRRKRTLGRDPDSHYYP